MVGGATGRLDTIRDASGAVLEALRELQKWDVLVGVPEEKSSRAEDKINSAELLYIHTHGIRRKAMRQEMRASMNAGATYSEAFALYLQSHGSPLWHSPPRPVLEPAIDANKEQIAEQLKKAALAALDGDKREVSVRLRAAGVMGQNIARGWFRDDRNNWPPNSPRTVKLKNGKDRPLVNTGALYKSIVYVLRKKGGGGGRD
jgi:hypothetical protein